MYRSYNARPVPRPRRERRSRRPLLTLLMLVLLAGLYTAYALLRPLPAISTTITPPLIPALVKVNIPWPTAASNEQAAFGADGYGLLAAKGPEVPVPTASVTKVITAMAVLEKKPLKAGEQGPNITITGQDVALYNQYVAKDGSVVPVYAGETITEYQALQAIMLPSANNVADTLAIWAFGSLEAYNQYANTYVRKLGMARTTITDASGFADSTVSTASDLIQLGDAVLDNPVLAEIANQKTAEFPGYGTIRNVNNLLGQNGINGIKTGNTEAAGGCFLGTANITAGGKTIKVITAVMGAPDLAQALRGTVPLVQTASSQFQTVRIVHAGQQVGKATTAWGASSAITAARDISVTTWTGNAVAPTSMHNSSLTAPAAAHAKAGELVLTFQGSKQTSELELVNAISSPTTWWRLKHPL